MIEKHLQKMDKIEGNLSISYVLEKSGKTVSTLLDKPDYSNITATDTVDNKNNKNGGDDKNGDMSIEVGNNTDDKTNRLNISAFKYPSLPSSRGVTGEVVSRQILLHEQDQMSPNRKTTSDMQYVLNTLHEEEEEDDDDDDEDSEYSDTDNHNNHNKTNDDNYEATKALILQRMKTFNEDRAVSSNGLGDSSNIAGLGISSRSRDSSRPVSSMSMNSDLLNVSTFSGESTDNITYNNSNNNTSSSPDGVIKFTNPSQRPKLTKSDTWNLISDVKKLKNKSNATDRMKVKVRNLEKDKKYVERNIQNAKVVEETSGNFTKPRLTKATTLEKLLGKHDMQFDQLVSQSLSYSQPQPSSSLSSSRSPSPAIALRRMANDGIATSTLRTEVSPEEKLKALLDKQKVLVDGASMVMGTSSKSYRTPLSNSKTSNPDTFEMHEIYDNNNNNSMINGADNDADFDVNLEMFNITPEGTPTSQMKNDRTEIYNNNNININTNGTANDANDSNSNGKGQRKKGNDGEDMDISLDDYFRENMW